MHPFYNAITLWVIQGGLNLVNAKVLDTRDPTNCEPWSVSNRKGMPVREKMSIIPWATALAVMVLSGIASGHLLAIQIAVRRNLQPPFPLGIGPIMSNAKHSKSSVNTSRAPSWLPACCTSGRPTITHNILAQVRPGKLLPDKYLNLSSSQMT